MEGSPQHRENIQNLLDKAHEEAIVDDKISNLDRDHKEAVLDDKIFEKMKSMDEHYKITTYGNNRQITVQELKKAVESKEGGSCFQANINGSEGICVSCSLRNKGDENSGWSKMSDEDKKFIDEFCEVVDIGKVW